MQAVRGWTLVNCGLAERLLCVLMAVQRAPRSYYFYYSGSFVLFIGMAVFGMSTLGRHTGVCVNRCPLAGFPTPSGDNALPGSSCTQELGYCMDVDACVEREEVLAMGPERANARGCFVCEGTNVFWPAHRSTALNKWHPAEPCGSGSVSYPQGGRLGDSYRMCWSTPLEMTLRDLTSPVLWLLAIAYLLQALGCLVGAAGMRHFSRWGTARLTALVRVRPALPPATPSHPPSRSCDCALRRNQQVRQRLAEATAVGDIRGRHGEAISPREPPAQRACGCLCGRRLCAYFHRPCLCTLWNRRALLGASGRADGRTREQEEAEDDFGRKLFFGDVSAFIGAVIGIFALTCVGGTAFRRAVPPETPFYTPRSRPDADASRATRFCVEPTCHYFSTIGP